MFNKLLPEFMWILAKGNLFAYWQLNMFFSRLETKGFSSQPHSDTLFFGTKLYIYHFKAILKLASYTYLRSINSCSVQPRQGLPAEWSAKRTFKIIIN